MKKLRNIVGLIAVLGMAAFMTGCGDDDNGDNNDNNPSGPQFAPSTAAGFIGKTYTVTTTTNGTATLTFPSATTYSFLPQGGNPETGTVANLHLDGEDWVSTITPDSDQGLLKAGEARVHFTDANAGTFTAPGADGSVITGTFTSVDNGGTTAGTTAGTTSGTTAGGAHPTALTNGQLQLDSRASGGGQELFSFPSSSTFTSDIGGSGTYTYTLNGDTANFDVTYTDANHTGDFYNLVLTYTGDKTGTFTGNQHFTGEDHNVSGVFTANTP